MPKALMSYDKNEVHGIKCWQDVLLKTTNK